MHVLQNVFKTVFSTTKNLIGSEQLHGARGGVCLDIVTNRLTLLEVHKKEHNNWRPYVSSAECNYLPSPLPSPGITLEPHRRQLHLSLAHQFQAKQQVQLEQLMSEINADAPAKWELHLYSRDGVQAQSEVCGSENAWGKPVSWL